MNIHFTKISFRNFLSFGNQLTSIQLDKPGSLLIVGENLDAGGSSGSGKTTAINAISYALYDKIPSNVSKDKLINRNNIDKKTLLEVILEFKKENDSYKIRRTRGDKNSIELWKNDIDITPDSSINFNNEIEKIVGISYNLFVQIVLFRGESKPFLDLSVSEQRNLIEELFRITTLSSKAKSLKKEISLTDKQVEIEKLLLKQQQSQIDNHNKHINDIVKKLQSWDLDKSNKINSIKSDLLKIENIDFDNEELARKEYDLNNLLLINSRTDIKSLEDVISKCKKQLDKEFKELSHLKSDQCPYCLQKFVDSSKKISELEIGIESTKLDIKEIESSLTEISNQYNEYTIKERELLKSIKHKDLSTLLKIKSNKDVLLSKLNDLEKSENPFIDTLESLSNSDGLIIDESKLNEASKLLEHQQFLLKLLTDKNSFIRKKILSKTIPFLNKRIQFYTDRFNLPHNVIFQSDMSCEIAQYGRELDHGNLSNGEKKRLNLALCFSFRDVLSYLHNKVNVLFTDEIDGGSLCSENIKHLTELIKQKAWEDKISVFCVSHSQTFQDAFDNHMIIRKENGFSTIQ